MKLTWENLPGRLVRTGLLMVLVSLSATSMAADIRYLNQLKSEATGTKVEKDAAAASGPTAPQPTSSSAATDTTKPSDYLQGLEAEAGVTEVDDSSQVAIRELKVDNKSGTPESNWDIDSQSLDSLRPDLNRVEFETILKHSYYASYIFYSKLDPTSQSLVYKSYQQDPQIQTVRSQIISLSK